MRVLFLQPLSPTMAWISPSRTYMLMLSFATTPGNTFVTAINSTANDMACWSLITQS